MAVWDQVWSSSGRGGLAAWNGWGDMGLAQLVAFDGVGWHRWAGGAAHWISGLGSGSVSWVGRDRRIQSERWGGMAQGFSWSAGGGNGGGVWRFLRGGRGGGLEEDDDERLVGMEEDPNRGLRKMMKWRKWTWATTSEHWRRSTLRQHEVVSELLRKHYTAV